MMERIPIPTDNVIGMRVTGKIEEDDIACMIADVEAMMTRHDDIHVYVEVASMQGISIAALFEDLKFVIPNLKRFTKKAVVSDKAWIETLTPIADKLFPSIDVRHFTPEQRDEALSWIQE